MGAALTAAAGAALGVVPGVVVAQAPLTLRWQSAWPAKDIFHEYALDYARRVGEMSGGRLKIEMLPAGAVVKPFDLLDAVSKGTLDGAHAVTTYWYAKNPALALWGSGPAFGMDGNTLLAWHYHGGGAALLEEIYRSLRLEVVSLLYGPMPNQPLGWFRKPVTRPEDFKGLKYRTVGLSMDIFGGLGAQVNALSAGEIVPALERGLLDAAEFNNASSDRLLGFPAVAAVCMLQSFHQPAEQLELLFNRRKFEALPADLKAIVRYAAESASADMSWKAMDRYSRDYQEMDRQGVRFMKTPEAVLQAQLRVWDEVAAKRAADNPFFARVLESQRAFARRCVRWQNDTFADSRLAWRHFFGGKS
ncbi:MAG: TRAP transporter substrate-binding protein [Betaproteobacteria bacterium]|nr:TRAP transporter substrate-binding protein [Betaproteobacteria bacterium]